MHMLTQSQIAVESACEIYC